MLGEGAFGCVYRVHDVKRGRELAVKVLRDNPRFIEQGKMEIHILKHLKRVDLQNNNNVIHLEDFFMFRGHLCMCFELLGQNLYEVTGGEGLPLNIVKKIGYQLLLSLKLLYKHGILHCDLKPENILVSDLDAMKIKLIDFGSACFRQDRTSMYIQSRYYRAPEIVLELGYSMPIDMWSFGCIMFEAYTGLPLFPANSSEDLIHRVVKVLGPPPEHITNKTSPKVRSKCLDGAPAPGKKASVLGKMLGDATFTDFVEKCLKWNPVERYTPCLLYTSPSPRDS